MFIEDCRGALGITHNKKNSDIEREIAWAQGELVRAGVPDAIVHNESDPLIRNAVVAGVCSHMHSDDRQRSEYKDIFLVTKDELRKHNWGC